MPCISSALTVAEAPRKNVSQTKEKVKAVPLKQGTLLSTANSNQPFSKIEVFSILHFS